MYFTLIRQRERRIHGKGNGISSGYNYGNNSKLCYGNCDVYDYLHCYGSGANDGYGYGDGYCYGLGNGFGEKDYKEIYLCG